MTDQLLNSIFKSLFTKEYKIKEIYKALAYCEQNQLLYLYLKQYHPKYINGNEVKSCVLVKDLSKIYN